MSHDPFGKIDFLLVQIKEMPGNSFEEQRANYADLVEKRIHELPPGDEWNSLMCLLGHLRGGMRRFERDFDLSFLPKAAEQVRMVA